jgi:hypothetical protein
MSNSLFCLIVASESLFSTAEIAHLAALTLFDSIKFNCIPIIVCDECNLPFDELIDWPLVSIRLKKSQLDKLIWILDNFSIRQIEHTLRRLKETYNNYFSSIKAITLNMIRSFESRIYSNQHFKSAPGIYLSSPVVAANKSKKFTALIVAEKNLKNVYFQIDHALLKCSHLSKIIILWHGSSSADALAQNFKLRYWNKNVNISIEPMGYAHRFTGIFYPFKSIDTEAVLIFGEDTFIEFDRIENAFSWWQHYEDRLILIESISSNSVSSPSAQLLFYHIYYSHYFYSHDAEQFLNRENVSNDEREHKHFLSFVYALTNKKPISYIKSKYENRSSQLT